MALKRFAMEFGMGTDLQGAVRRASAERRFHTGEMRIKVGMHFGTALEEMDDLLGEARRGTPAHPARQG